MDKQKKVPILFTKKFLDIDDQGMTFHDAIIRLANFHDIEPEYIQKKKLRVFMTEDMTNEQWDEMQDYLKEIMELE